MYMATEYSCGSLVLCHGEVTHELSIMLIMRSMKNNSVMDMPARQETLPLFVFASLTNWGLLYAVRIFLPGSEFFL